MVQMHSSFLTLYEHDESDSVSVLLVPYLDILAHFTVCTHFVNMFIERVALSLNHRGVIV